MATSVSAEGRREVLGSKVGDSENTVFWTGFCARGLGGVRLVISDHHGGAAGGDGVDRGGRGTSR